MGSESTFYERRWVLTAQWLCTFGPEGPAIPGGPVKPRMPLWP